MSLRALALIAAASLLSACGSSSNNSDAGTPDAGASDAGAADAGTWPPATPWYTETTCSLPTCSTTAPAVPFDSSGNWTITLKTTASDCNANVQALDDRLKVGNVHSGSAHPLDITGSCDYTTANGTRIQDGTFGGSTLVTCQVAQRLQGVVEVDESTVTFGTNGTATGQATAFFTNFPDALGQTDNKCQASFDVTMQRSP